MNTKLSRDRIITTYTGKKVKRSLCKKIKGEYYVVGDNTIKDSGGCYLVEGTYHRYNNNKIEYDHEAKTYVLIHKHHLKHGIVDVDNNEPIFGYYTPNLTENINLYEVDNSIKAYENCISEDVSKKLGFREHIGSGNFYHKTKGNANFFKKIGKASINKRALPYDSRFASTITRTQYNEFYNPTYDNEQLNILGDFLEKNGITFGVEFETINGFIPDRLCYKYGLIALRDGSIEGIEYVTIPYSGRKGLYALQNVCKELYKRTKFDYTCALHLHLGGLDRNMTSILSSYILGYLIQGDMFKLQPSYKELGLGIKSKNYCAPLNNDLFKSINGKINNSNVTNEFSKLFKFISDGRDFSRYNNNLSEVKSHPSDPEGTRKWQIRSRYHWLNFVPIVFGNKQTLEFRHHNATFDFNKIIQFIFNCAVFIKISNSYSKDVLIDNSDLSKDLRDKSLNKLEVMSNFLLLNGHSELKSIITENKIYNEARENIMKTMTTAGDVIGNTEGNYDKDLNSKINTSLWE